jgi:hypothetical protein
MIDLPFALDPGIELSMATRGMSKGILQSEDPQFIGRFLLKADRLTLATQWKNVTSSLGDGEASASASLALPVKPVELAVGINYKHLTGVKGDGDTDAWEFNGSAQRKLGGVTLRFAAVYSPDDIGSTGQSLYLEGGTSLDLSKGWKISGSVGRRSRASAPDYRSYNVGIAKSVAGKMTVEVRYFGTDQGERGDLYRERLVGLIRLGF